MNADNNIVTKNTLMLNVIVTDFIVTITLNCVIIWFYMTNSTSTVSVCSFPGIDWKFGREDEKRPLLRPEEFQLYVTGRNPLWLCAYLNEGDAFNLASGIFTAHVKGIYHFQFSAVKDSSATYLSSFLQVNGVNIGEAYTSKTHSEPKVTGTRDTVCLIASLRLAKGDTVKMWNNGIGVLHDDGDHHTHFSGWLVEEDLM